MGVNLLTACHKHKVKIFHFRNEEDRTMMPFYYKHRDCLKEDPTKSVETLEDQEQERDWMADPEYGGYEDDVEVKQLGCDHHRVKDGVCEFCEKKMTSSETRPERLKTER
jgi:hypothetical protein